MTGAKIKNIFRRIFFQKSYNYYSTIEKVSQGLATFFDREKIYTFIGDITFSSLDLKSLFVLSSGSNGDFHTVFSRNHETIPINDRLSAIGEHGCRVRGGSSILAQLRSSGNIIVRERLKKCEAVIGKEAVADIKRDMDLFQGKVAVPVFVDNTLELFLMLGQKVAGHSFTSEDLNMLNTIAHQTAIAFKNAHLYAEKIHSEKLASIGMMSVTFAHEIRNPLTSLKTFAQLMPEKYHDAEFRDKFSKIVLGEIERINVLIEDLLDVSSKKSSPGIRLFSVRDLLDEMVLYVKSKMELEKRNVSIEKDYDYFEAHVSGNAGRLRHAFLNILNNGCQAMDGEGVLRINVVPNDNSISIAIEDNGHGIPPEHIDSIYEPFVTTKDMGMGLGLTISKKIIEDHGGSIAVESNKSQGTTFTVTLPMSSG